MSFELLPGNVKGKLNRSINSGRTQDQVSLEFGPEMAAPAGHIFRTIRKTGHWPRQWCLEYGILLKKTTNPVNEDDLRVSTWMDYRLVLNTYYVG